MLKYNKINKSFLVLFALYCAISFFIVTSVYSYSERFLEKEIVKLQADILINSEIKADNLKKWMVAESDTIASVSENLSVSLYLSEGDKNLNSDEKQAQRQFLKNYLLSEGKKSGFSSDAGKTTQPAPQPTVNKTPDMDGTDLTADSDDYNSEPPASARPAPDHERSDATLAIFDNNEKMVVSLGLQPNIEAIYKTINKPSSYDSYFNVVFSKNNDEAYMVFIKSIKHIQNDKSVGYVLGIKKVTNDFINISYFPPENNGFGKTDVVVKDGDSVIILNDTANGTFSKLSPSETGLDVASLVATRAVDTIVERFDRYSVKVLALSKEVYDNKIFVVYRVDKEEALKTAKKFNKNLLWLTGFAEISIGLLLLLAWSHSTSVKYIKLSDELNKQTTLLKLVTDNQLQSMFLLSGDNHVLFANRTFLNKNVLELDDVLDKPLTNVLGANLADEYIEMTKLDTVNPVMFTKKIDGANGQISYVQRKCLPVSGFNTVETYYLFAENDITSLMKERARYEANLGNVIETLIRIIEQRSVYFHNHSQRLAELSQAIADDLKLDAKMKRAVEISSRLCNLYVALLPREIINKQGKLSEEEKKMFADFPKKTIDIVRNLEFDAPVIETLTHLMERPDGTGPEGLTDKDIIVSAKILKVVNDYVAMTSDRPYREKMQPKKAIDILLREKDARYSSQVVFALANYLKV